MADLFDPPPCDRTPPAASVERWHKTIAALGAELCAALVRRRIRPGAAAAWADRLEAVVREMRR